MRGREPIASVENVRAAAYGLFARPSETGGTKSSLLGCHRLGIGDEGAGGRGLHRLFGHVLGGTAAKAPWDAGGGRPDRRGTFGPVLPGGGGACWTGH